MRYSWNTKIANVSKGKTLRKLKELLRKSWVLVSRLSYRLIYFAQNYGKKFITSSQEDKGEYSQKFKTSVFSDRARDEARQLEKKEKELLTDLRYKVELHKQKVSHVRDKRDQLKAFAEREAGRINSLKIKLSGNLAELFKKIIALNP